LWQKNDGAEAERGAGGRGAGTERFCQRLELKRRITVVLSRPIMILSDVTLVEIC